MDEGSTIWYHAESMRLLFCVLFSAAGYVVQVNTQHSTDTSIKKFPFSHFGIDAEKIRLATVGSTDYPEGLICHNLADYSKWAQRLSNFPIQKARHLTAQYHRKRGLVLDGDLDPRLVLWEEACAVKEATGVRTPVRMHNHNFPDSLGHYSKVIDFLKADRQRLAALDKLKEDLASSAELTNWVLLGQVTPYGTLNVTKPFGPRRNESRRLMRVRPDEEYMWFSWVLPQIIAPVAREALSLRRQLEAQGAMLSLPYLRTTVTRSDPRRSVCAIVLTLRIKQALRGGGGGGPFVDRPDKPQAEPIDLGQYDPLTGLYGTESRWVEPLVPLVVRRAYKLRVEREEADEQRGAPIIREATCWVKTGPETGSDEEMAVMLNIAQYLKALRKLCGTYLNAINDEQAAFGAESETTRLELRRVEGVLAKIGTQLVPIFDKLVTSLENWEAEGSFEIREAEYDQAGVELAWRLNVFASTEVEADGDAAGKNRKNKEQKGEAKDKEQEKGKDAPVKKGKRTERSKQYDDGGDEGEDINLRWEEAFEEPPTTNRPPPPSANTSIPVRIGCLEEEVSVFNSEWEKDRLFVTAKAILLRLRQEPSLNSDSQDSLHNFLRPAYEANLQIISNIWTANRDFISLGAWLHLLQQLSLLLALCLLSSRPWLCTGIVHFLLDEATSNIVQNGPNVDEPLALGILTTVRSYADGCVMCCQIGSRTCNAKDYSASSKEWIWAVVYRWPTFGYQDRGHGRSTPCEGCNGRRPLVIPADDVGPAFMGVRIEERLTVSVREIRRGWSHASTKPYGRLLLYYCLVIFFHYRYHPTFVVTWTYYAYLVHQEDKEHRHKPVIVLTREGMKLVNHA